MSKDAVLARAQELARSQRCLAKSPAERSEAGSTALCAGSCIARSAIELAGDTASLREFDRIVLAADKFVLLPAVFRRYGLSETSAINAIRENDSRDAVDRLPWFLSLQKLE
jgi:hypothetical protein